MLNAFNIVFLMDNTYKTNKYNDGRLSGRESLKWLRKMEEKVKYQFFLFLVNLLRVPYKQNSAHK